MVLSITVLTGFTVDYQEPVLENEVILLVDVSHSGKDSQEKKDKFIKDVLDAGGSIFRFGIVTFGYGQVEAAALSNNADKVYNDYLNSPRPDDPVTGVPFDSATNIAAALNFTKDLFTKNEAGRANNPAKIVLMTDGCQTDGRAESVIVSIAATGIQVDTVFFGNEYEPEVQINGIEFPDYSIPVNSPVDINVKIQSSFSGTATLTLYDNDTPSEPKPIDLAGDGEEQNIIFVYRFENPGAHRVRIEISDAAGDTLTQNNAYHAYLFLTAFDRILILDKSGEAAGLKTLLEGEYSEDQTSGLDVRNIAAAPSTVEELRNYDQIILVNIANADMPDGFDALLRTYVHDYGGGLLTVGGTKTQSGADVANTYVREDMEGSIYQQMLPVECIDYTPPIAVMIIIDKSGSMSTRIGGGETKLTVAKKGAKVVVDLLTERDFVGVITLTGNPQFMIGMTPVTQKNKVHEAIDRITIGSTTVYSSAIRMAGQALNALTDIARRHIIFMSDGDPGDGSSYIAEVSRLAKKGEFTFTSVMVGPGSQLEIALMRNIANLGFGNYFQTNDSNNLARDMISDVEQLTIEGMVEEKFTPAIKDYTPAVQGLIGAQFPELGGFFGSKARDEVEIPLTGLYGVPIYAQWKFGKGKVGSFMCDLGGKLSGTFLTDSTGERFIKNVIAGLFPLDSVRPKNIEAAFQQPDNYTVQVRITTPAAEGERFIVQVTHPADGDGKILIAEPEVLERENLSFKWFTVTFSRPGIYSVNIQKINSAGNVILENEEPYYTAFSYSKEYDIFAYDEAACREFLEKIASNGKGAAVPAIAAGSLAVLEGFPTAIGGTLDPRIALIITSIVLFLLDIAVRKFKFKWPWEIVRYRKAKKALESGKEQNLQGQRFV